MVDFWFGRRSPADSKGYICMKLWSSSSTVHLNPTSEYNKAGLFKRTQFPCISDEAKSKDDKLLSKIAYIIRQSGDLGLR